MKKETQDLIWACLPKEAREEIKKDYKSHPSAYHPYFNEGYGEALKIYFGKHNLTSDTEPEEMLMVERKRIQEDYKHHLKFANDADDQWHSGIIFILSDLFGDKCLPDKEPSAQVEPKKFFESDYGIGNKVVVCISSIGEPRKEVVTLIRQYQPQCENNDYAKTWVIQTQDGQTFQSNEEHFEPYTEPEAKDNMEKKKFDLYVHGNLISRGYCSCNGRDNDAGITEHVSFEEVDTKHGIIVEGDMQVDNLYTMNKKIGASGFICGRGTAVYSKPFKSAKGTNQ